MRTLRINRLNGNWRARWDALAANPPTPANLKPASVSPKRAA